MPENLFTFLFKYRPVIFEKGRLAFEASGLGMLVTTAVVVAVLTAASYLRQGGRVGGHWAGALIVLRTLSVALVLFVLVKPVLRVSTVVPGENFLAVLIDDSRSMRLADSGPASRGELALAAFTEVEVPGTDRSAELAAEDLPRRLNERFTLRYYRFSEAASRMDPSFPLRFEGRRSHLAAALDQAREDLHGVPLAGAVLVSDGADNAGSAGDPITDSLLQLKSRGIPVYTVGLGEERFARDVEIVGVNGPDRVLEGSAFAVEVNLGQRGYDGETLTLTAEREGAIVTTREVSFDGGQAATVRVHLEAAEEGTYDYRFSITAGEGERVQENNERRLLVSVEDRRERILYFEGEPRWEVKFLRQAVRDDNNIEVVVLQRTAPNKYLRLGVEDALELTTGFPETREELFAYRGLILGSVEASFFTHHQLRILEEFVSERGGGLLLLGGRRSFAEGGYAGTPLENVYPLELAAPRSDDDPFFAEVKVEPTPTGLAHEAIQLGGTLEASRQRWAALPPLSIRNPLSRAKPGATVLLTGADPGGGEDLIVLASQRYGKGRVLAFPVQDSWQWQMHSTIPLDDRTHERLWSQLLRWLVNAVPDQVRLDLEENRFAPGEVVELRAEVRDAAFMGLNGARVSATITDPLGVESTVPLEWTVDRDGEYRGSWIPEVEGAYDVRIDAEHRGRTVGSDRGRWVAAPSSEELFDAEMNAPLLRRIAEQTGGRFYTLDSVGDLAEDVRFTDSGKTVEETFELWDMPIVLLALLVSLSAEWGLRRGCGLV